MARADSNLFWVFHNRFLQAYSDKCKPEGISYQTRRVERRGDITVRESLTGKISLEPRFEKRFKEWWDISMNDTVLQFPRLVWIRNLLDRHECGSEAMTRLLENTYRYSQILVHEKSW